MMILLQCTSSDRAVLNLKEKDSLIAIAAQIYQRGLTQGTGGDISVRIPGTNRIVVKATGNSLGSLDYQKLVTIDLEGKVIEGVQKPSQEAEIHRQLYLLRSDIGAIMHMHSPYATAWATVGKQIPVITQQAISVFKGAALVPYGAVGSETLTASIIAAYKNPETHVVLMQNHGTFIVGKNLEDILYQAEVVESTAQIAYLCKALGTPLDM